MKTRLELLKWLMIILLSAGTLGAWAQNQNPTQTVCIGSQPYYVDPVGGTPGSTYTWTLSGGGTITSGNGTSAITVDWTIPGGPYTLTVVENDGSCLGLPQSVAVTVNPTPDVNLPPNQIVCNGALTNAVIFTGSVAGTVFNWVNDNIAIGLGASGTGDIPAFTATNIGTTPIVGTITVTPTYTSGGITCTGTPQVFTITVNPTTTVDPVANVAYCNGATTAVINFTSPVAGTTFAWTNSDPSIGLGASGTGAIPSFTAINLGTTPVIATITVTPTANGCTGVPITFTITVNPSTTVDPVANVAYCNGATTAVINFTSPVAGTTFAWTNSDPSIGLGASGTGAIPSFTAINLGTTPVIATITVTPTANGCTGLPITFTITVNPSTTVDPVANVAYCNGATTAVINFTSPVLGTTFAWTNSDPSIGLGASGTGAIPSFTATNLGTTPVIATITVTPTANGCTGVPITFTITVNPSTTVDPVANVAYCNGATTAVINFTSPVLGTTFAWTNSDPSIGLGASGTGAIPSFTATNLGTTPVIATITVTPTANGCTGVPITFTITVNPSTTVDPVANVAYCNGATTAVINFTSPVAGTTFAWTNSDPSIGLGASGTGPIPSFTATNLGTTPVIATITVTPSANACGGTPITFTITVNPSTTVDPVANVAYCNGATTAAINFTSPVAGTTFAWTNSDPSIGLGASGAGNIPSFTATNLGTTPVIATITVTPTANGCTGLPITFTITVNPSTTVDPVANVAYCNGATTAAINFTSPVLGTTFAWTNSDPSIGLGASGIGNIPSFTAINLGTTPVIATITVTPTANGCTGVPITFTITVNPSTTVDPVANVAYCNGATTAVINFTSPVLGTTFAWTNSDPSIGLGASGAGNIPSFTAINLGTTPVIATITVTPTANGCTGVPITFTITVNPSTTVDPVANVAYCNGATTAVINFTSPVAGTTFAWTNSDPSIGLGASGTGAIPSFTTINLGTTPVIATITVTPTANGCTGLPITFTITVNPSTTVDPVANVAYCNGATTAVINFTSPVLGTTFAWTNSDPSIGLGASGTGAIPSFTATNLGTTPVIATITVTPTANGCTGVPITFTITVNPSTTVDPVANVAYCNGATTAVINFTSPVLGTTFAWTNSDPSIGLGASGTGAIPSFTATNLGTTPVIATITVTPTANGCTGVPITFTITVNPSTTVDPVANVAYCNGATTAVINFTSPVAGTTFAWTNSDPSIGLGASGTGPIPSFTATNLGTTPVIATITVTPSANACGGTPITFTITVNPSTTVDPVANVAYCNGATTAAINFTSPVAGTTFAWTNSDPSIGLGASGAGNIPSFTATNLGTTPVIATITVTPTANGCTGLPITFTITVNPSTTVDPVANVAYCNGATTAAINFTSPVLGTTFAWTNSDPSIGLGASGIGNIPSFTAINLGTTPVIATITVTPTANGCTGVPITFTITVNPSTTVDPVANVAYCNGATTAVINFTSPVLGTTFAWTNSDPSIGLGASGAGNIPSFTAINLGTTPVIATITVTPTANGCTGVPITFTITVNPSTTVDPVANVAYCNGATTAVINFTSPVAGTTFAWTNSDPSIGLGASGVGNIPSFTAINLGTTPVIATITVTPTANGCTGLPITFTITVNPSTTVDPVANVAYCNGATTAVINFTSPVLGTTFAWTNSDPSIGLGASGTGAIPSFTATNLGTTPVIATITVTPTANGCTGVPITFTITVNPSTTVDPVANVAYCNGATTAVINFTSPVLGTTFAWTNSDPSIGLGASGTGAIPSFTATNLGTTPVIATITVTPTANGCTGLPITFTITVNPSTTVDPVANVAYCNGATTAVINFTSPVAGTTFAWTNSDPSIGLGASGTGAIPSFTATNLGTTPVIATITVTPSANACGGTPITFTITVNPSTTVDPVANVAYCNGATTAAINFTSPVAGTTFAWTNSDPTIGLGASGAGNIPSFTATNLGTTPVIATITVTPTANGCTGVPITFTITVNPSTTVDPVANVAYCNGATTAAINFTSPVAGTTFAWTNSDPSIGLGASGAGPIPSFTATNLGTTPVIATITVTPTANGCTGLPITFTITVNPSTTVDPVANVAYCNGATTAVINFTSPVAGTTFAWTNSDPSIGLGASGTGAIPSFTATNLGTTPVIATITVTPTANGCTGVPITFTITVNPSTTVDPVANVAYCNGATTAVINFTSPVAGTTFAWTNSDPSIGLGASGVGNIPSFTAINLGTTPVIATITVTPTANGCTGVPITFTITVNPTPIPTITGTTPVCVNSTDVVYSTEAGMTNYFWTITAGGTITAGQSTNSINVTWNSVGPQTITVTYTNGYNCTALSPTIYNVTVDPLPSTSLIWHN